MAAEQLRVEPARALVGHVAVPDFPTAAPLLVAASLLSGSELTVHDVGVEPGRVRLLDVLEHMGARIAAFNRRRSGRPVADLEVRSAELVAVTVDGDQARDLDDELALFAVAAGGARGTSVVRIGRDLSDVQREWIDSVSTALRALGIRAQKRHDGLGVRGVPTRPKGGGMDPRGDSRLAIAGITAGLVSREGVVLKDPDLIPVSFPGFFELLDSVTQR
jgi:3-phosphoshikimate 1-carboxyvinyltransferase